MKMVLLNEASVAGTSMKTKGVLPSNFTTYTKARAVKERN
jgi:hypothetical protein